MEPWTGEPPTEEKPLEADVSQLGHLDWSSACKIFALAVVFVGVVVVALKFFAKS